jgi:hypothetical protein
MFIGSARATNPSAAKDGPARGGLDQSIDHPQAGRLAASGGADQHRDLTGVSLQVKAVDSDGAVCIPFRY